MSQLDLSVVLPAYEEAENLDRLLPALRRALAGLECSFEIIVVDAPMQRDATPDLCLMHGATWLPRTGGGLYGDAVRTGVRAARGHRIAVMDADGSHDPDFIARLWAAREGNDLVIASRYVKGGSTENPAVLILMSLAVNMVFRVALGLNCADVSNSFRLYRGDQLRALRLECGNFDIVEEILVKLSVAVPGFRIKEVPFAFHRRRAGKTKRDLVRFALGYIGTLRKLVRMKQACRIRQMAE